MNDLPDPASQGNPKSQIPNPKVDNATVTGIGIGTKEVEPGGALSEATQGAGSSESMLPKEVTAAGVRVHPTSIPIPQPVAQMGVTPAGKNVPPPPVPAVALPLTDDKIAEGLKQTITSSWLWLAHWCLKKLKQIHLGIQSIHGKTVRVKI